MNQSREAHPLGVAAPLPPEGAMHSKVLLDPDRRVALSLDPPTPEFLAGWSACEVGLARWWVCWRQIRAAWQPV
jgi:hypothetical protein